MRTHVMSLLAVSGALWACSEVAKDEKDEGGARCGDVTGNYSVTSTVLSGTCPEKSDGTATDNFGFTIETTNGTTGIILPGVVGACPGTLDADCRFKAQCEILSKSGELLAGYNVDYTFREGVVTGSLVGALAAGVVAPDAGACTSTEKHEGARL